MAVYVDDMDAPFRGMLMSHMMADSTQELIEMAHKIGVNVKWIQYPGTFREHFDIAKAKKALAIKNGARLITWAQMGQLDQLRQDSLDQAERAICKERTTLFRFNKNDYKLLKSLTECALRENRKYPGLPFELEVQHG